MANGPLMILGGGRYQLPAIKAATRLGIETLVLDWGENPPGKQASTLFKQCDTTDIPAALGIARQFDISGVIAPATDVAVPTQAAICRELGLVGPRIEAANILCHKTNFRDWCRANGAQHPTFLRLSGPRPPTELLFVEAILKPDFSSGGRGARKVSSIEELDLAWPDYLAASPAGDGVLEEWVEGVNVTLEGFLLNGEWAFSMITEQIRPEPPCVATGGHRFPSSLLSSQIIEIQDLVSSISARLDYNNGPIDADLIYHPVKGAYIIEMAPRLGGNELSKFAMLTHGVDLPKATVLAAIRRFDDAKASLSVSQSTQAAQTSLIQSQTGGHLTYTSLVKPWPAGLIDLVLDYPSDSVVPSFRSGRDRLGAITVAADRPEDLPDLIKSAYQALDWRIEPLDDEGAS